VGFQHCSLEIGSGADHIVADQNSYDYACPSHTFTFFLTISERVV